MSKHVKDRIYVCHTFYHVYIAVIKELNLPEEDRGNATLVLSTMSNDFGSMKERAEKIGLFEAVYVFDEKEDTQFPHVMAYHRDRGNLILNLLQRIRYTRELGKAQQPNVPVDFKDYKDIYVFCDSDPIGHYLNYKHIYYHALEDSVTGDILSSKLFLRGSVLSLLRTDIPNTVWIWKSTILRQ